MIELRGYIDEYGKKRFAEWFDGLDPVAAAKVTIALARMEKGNFSKSKALGQESSSTKSISAPATVFTSARTARAL